jgi:hypothetical protein
MNLVFVHLFHILFVGSLFLYVGIQKRNIPSWLYPSLLILGILIIPYHIYKAFHYWKKGINPWFNLIHIFLVGPLLVWIGYQNKKAPLYSYDLLLMLGFASIGYHSYYLYKEMK